MSGDPFNPTPEEAARARAEDDTIHKWDVEAEDGWHGYWVAPDANGHPRLWTDEEADYIDPHAVGAEIARLVALIPEPYPTAVLDCSPADDPVLADEGYPSDEELARIATWPASGRVTDLFAYMRIRWTWADWGWHEGKDDDGRTLVHLSTGGWSGNEELLGALRQNRVVYFNSRVQERVGGHYIFELPLYEAEGAREE